ncbi:uncharacterized protein [Euphorbia lathyris]|uniref:uncharacterized protein n=1 Tax=Euphorbia lathyris TaxID=212925 RepID=UPI0033130D83
MNRSTRLVTGLIMTGSLGFCIDEIHAGYMNRPTRFVTGVNSPDLHRFVAGTIGFGSFDPQKTLTCNDIQFSSPRFSQIGSFATNSINTLRHELNTPAMDPYHPESSGPPPVSEDFFHIENPNPNMEPLSEGIVDVAAELREEHGEVAVSGGEPERRELPEELSKNVVVLTCESTVKGGSCDVYLIGTCHGSEESCKQVQAVIQFLKPQVVYLELCCQRVNLLTSQNVEVGVNRSEFRVAVEEASAYGGEVFLGDWHQAITLWRTWAKMPLWHKIKFFYCFLLHAVFQPSPDDLSKMPNKMDAFDKFNKEFPTMMETLVHERDQVMSFYLLKVASKHSSVVAVVGKGHLEGIKKRWKQPVEEKHLRELMEMPSEKTGVSVVTSLSVAVAAATIASRIYFRCKK